MDFIRKAVEYVFSVLSEDETLRKFPREFVAAAAQWVRAWFLTDEDPRTKAKLEDPERSAESKKTVIETKLEDLLAQSGFRQELEAQLARFAAQKERLKNAIEGSDIDASGSVRIGDSGPISDAGTGDKNIVRDTKIRAGGDFRLGDDIAIGNQNVQITHNYYTHTPPPPDSAPRPASPDLRERVEEAISMGHTDEAIKLMRQAAHLKARDEDAVTLLSGRYRIVQRQLNQGLLSEQEANREIARISKALLDLL